MEKETQIKQDENGAIKVQPNSKSIISVTQE